MVTSLPHARHHVDQADVVLSWVLPRFGTTVWKILRYSLLGGNDMIKD